MTQDIMRRPPAVAKSASGKPVDPQGQTGAIYRLRVKPVREETVYRFERLRHSSRYLAHKLGVNPAVLDDLWRDVIAELRAERDRWRGMALGAACMGVA